MGVGDDIHVDWSTQKRLPCEGDGPQYALNTASYARSMHLGLRRVKQYSYMPTAQQPSPLLGLLPIRCGLTY